MQLFLLFSMICCSQLCGVVARHVLCAVVARHVLLQLAHLCLAATTLGRVTQDVRQKTMTCMTLSSNCCLWCCRGHIVPPLLREHLSVLRAFLIAMQDLPAQQAHVQERQQQQAAAAASGSSKLDPLEPPQPIWETEAEQVGLGGLPFS
jgi:hypothetical protein